MSAFFGYHLMEMQTCVFEFDVICWEIYGPIVRWADRRNNPLKVAQFSSLHFFTRLQIFASYFLLSCVQQSNGKLPTSHFSTSFSFIFLFLPIFSFSAHFPIKCQYFPIKCQYFIYILDDRLLSGSPPGQCPNAFVSHFVGASLSRVSFLIYRRNNPY